MVLESLDDVGTRPIIWRRRTPPPPLYWQLPAILQSTLAGAVTSGKLLSRSQDLVFSSRFRTCSHLFRWSVIFTHKRKLTLMVYLQKLYVFLLTIYRNITLESTSAKSSWMFNGYLRSILVSNDHFTVLTVYTFVSILIWYSTTPIRD